MQSQDLQHLIHFTIKNGIEAVGSKVFYFHSERKCYHPRNGCLKADYSSEEAIVCGILLYLFFEMYGIPSDIDFPKKRNWENSVVDVIWPGAYFFMPAYNRLTDTGSWDAICELLSGSHKGMID